MKQANSELLTPNSESGITLIISIVLLAAVTFISFALSTIIIREIRSAQVILVTEPAIAGAASGGEIGLFQLFRETGNTNISGTTPQSGASFDIEPDLYDDPFPFTVQAGQELQVSLHDAERLTNQNANYGSFTLTADESSSPLRIEVYSWADTTDRFCTTTVTAGNSSTCSALTAADDRYIIAITALGQGTGSGQITATDNSGLRRGVPSGAQTLEVTGSNQSVQRKIQISF